MIAYEGAWTDQPECPLSGCMRYVHTHDHGWALVSRREKTPHSSSGQMCWCDCHGRKYRIRVRQPGDGGPGQD